MNIVLPTQAVPLQFFTYVFRHRAYRPGFKHCTSYLSARGAPAPRVTGSEASCRPRPPVIYQCHW